jgi:hypothetical protein
MSWFGMASTLLAGSRPYGQSPEYPLLSRTVMEPPVLGEETLNALELALALELGLAPPLLPPLLHAAAITITAILRLAVPNERSLNPMAFTCS